MKLFLKFCVPIVIAFILMPISLRAAEVVAEVDHVGFSNNTNTLFLRVKQNIGSADNVCHKKDYFRLPFDDKLADKAFAIALSASVAARLASNALADPGFLALRFAIYP